MKDKVEEIVTFLVIVIFASFLVILIPCGILCLLFKYHWEKNLRKDIETLIATPSFKAESFSFNIFLELEEQITLNGISLSTRDLDYLPTARDPEVPPETKSLLVDLDMTLKDLITTRDLLKAFIKKQDNKHFVYCLVAFDKKTNKIKACIPWWSIVATSPFLLLCQIVSPLFDEKNRGKR